MGKCTKCGNYICSECALLFKEKFYCVHSCAPSEIIPAQPQPNLCEPQIQENQDFQRFRSVIFWSSVSLALCSLVFGAWALRESHAQKKEISVLKKNRQLLLSNLKKNNSEIRELKSRLISFSDSTAYSPHSYPKNIEVSERKGQILQSVVSGNLVENGFPLSITNGSSEKNLVALTFDGGSTNNAAQDILDTLSSRSVKATMFLTGQFIRKYPELVKKIALENHELGNHTLTHPHLTMWSQNRTQTTLPIVDARFIANQLSSNDSLLLRLTGKSFAPLWRAPFGEFNKTICRWAFEQGYVHVGWRQGKTWMQTLDTNDWIPNEDTPGYRSPQEVLHKIMTMAETKPYGLNGGIILMHLGTDRTGREQQVHLILGTLIDTLRHKGYEPVTVSELIRQSGIDLALVPPKKHFPEASITGNFDGHF